MSDRPTILLEHHLKELRLPTFLREYDRMAEECAEDGVGHPDYLLRLSELELIDRHHRAVERRIKAARFPALKSLDTFDFSAIPSVNRQLVTQLARCEYIDRRENLIAVGNSGTGKTHVALGLGLAACQRGLTVGFTTAAALVHELIEATDERRLLNLQKRLSRLKLLIIDELGCTLIFPTTLKVTFLEQRNLVPLEMLPQRMAYRRAELGISQRELAEILEISIHSVVAWEGGGKPGSEMHQLISNWLAEELPHPPLWPWDSVVMGQRIRDHRTAWGHSLADLAEILGTFASQLSSWERGLTPSVKYRRRILAWLEKDAPHSDIVTWNGEKMSQRILGKRLALGLTQRELADQFSVGTGVLEHWEGGQRPSKQNRRMLLDWLGDDDFYMDIDHWDSTVMGQRIREKRLALGLSSMDIATYFSTSCATLESWESGKIPSRHNRKMLLDWLGDNVFYMDIDAWTDAGMGRLIRDRRLAWGMSLEDLGEHLGVHAETVGHWEVDLSIPHPAARIRILNWLNEEVTCPAVWPWDGEEIGKRIRDRRLALEMSQPQLAEQFGVSTGTVGSWERGRTPSHTQRRLVSAWLAEEVPVRMPRQAQTKALVQRMMDRRQALRISRRKMARNMGVSQTDVHYWEQGRTLPNEENRRKIVEWLDRTDFDPVAQLLPGMAEFLKAA